MATNLQIDDRLITDFLICAVAARVGLTIFTTDRDFQLFADHLPIALHEVREFNPKR